MKINMKKGFTLIELLIVIAIIGILSATVLITFPTAAKQAKDSRVISAIGQIRTVMASFYSVQGSYTSPLPLSCTNPEEMPILCAEVKKNNLDKTDPVISKYDDETAGEHGACVYSKLNRTTGAPADAWYYCADSTGIAGSTKTDPSTTCKGTPAAVGDVVCPTDVQ